MLQCVLQGLLNMRCHWTLTSCNPHTTFAPSWPFSPSRCTLSQISHHQQPSRNVHRAWITDPRNKQEFSTNLLPQKRWVHRGDVHRILLEWKTFKKPDSPRCLRYYCALTDTIKAGGRCQRPGVCSFIPVCRATVIDWVYKIQWWNIYNAGNFIFPGGDFVFWKRFPSHKTVQSFTFQHH